nr:PIN domain-containing protein [Halorussus salinus]
MSRVTSGEFGRPYTTDYVYDETVTLVRSRTNSFREAAVVGDRILGRDRYPDAIDFVTISEELFDRSVAVFDRYRDHDLSFTDASTVALIEEHGFDAVLAFDDDFDGLVPRLDPAEIAA